jgi:hypothetical protein
MTDPLEIINEFMNYTPDVGPCPIHVNSGHWLRKLCALAERCARAENLTNPIIENIVTECWIALGKPLPFSVLQLPKKIAALKEATWIPASERLPEEDENYGR